MALFRVLMCGVYLFITKWFVYDVMGSAEPEKRWDASTVHSLWIAIWIIVGMKILFLTLQDMHPGLHFLKIVLDVGLIYIFAPEVLWMLLVGIIILPAGFAWSNITLESHLATGHGPLEVRRAMSNIIKNANRVGPDEWTQ